ncbi:MAG: hypothetical protein IH614_04955 [Desulfuromonadales bacterium]|nr:hypothetical protein [Desulfuromonadales bacterium]
MVVFLGHWHLEQKFDALQAFAQYDVLFDADPNVRLVGFAHGWGAFNRNLLHPNLANLVNPPIRLVAIILHAGGLGDSDLLLLRRSLALLVSPLVAALQALALIALFRQLGYARHNALLLALLGSLSFSQLIFASVPDHFSLSNLILTGSFILAVQLAQQGKVHWPAWLLAAWLAASVTLTNVLIVGLLFWVPLLYRHQHWRTPTRQAALLVGVASLCTFASYHLLNLGYDSDPQPATAAVTWTGHFWRDDLAANLGRFPTSLADSLAPPAPQAVPIRYHWPRQGRYDFQFTLEQGEGIFSLRNPLGSVIFVLLAAGTLVHLRAGGSRASLAMAALAVLLYNGLFHGIWGHEYFLYSQHWLTATLFLLGGVLNCRLPFRTWGVAILVALTGTIGLNNLLHLRLVLTVLERG